MTTLRNGVFLLLILLYAVKIAAANSTFPSQNENPIANFYLNEDDTTRYTHHYLRAQESCYEQYLREQNMTILTAEDADDSYDELKKTVLAKQMYGDSYLLMVDTIAQRTMITKVDGTYIADVHVALVDSTWYMWLSVDPLADKNIANSPYMYCNGNPIRFINPDGKDVWELSDDGTIKARILDKTQDAIAMKGKSISFDYGTIDRGYNGRECNNTKYTYFQFVEGEENEAASAFKFLADNSNVEYALANTDREMSGVYTNHKKNEVLTVLAVARVETLSEAKMTDNYHSHPNGTMFPSGLKDGKGDIGFARSKGDAYGFYIYPTRSNRVIEYFSNGSYNSIPQSWPYQNAGTISPYVRQSGIPALFRKLGIK